jgi:hypothetical protein
MVLPTKVTVDLVWSASALILVYEMGGIAVRTDNEETDVKVLRCNSLSKYFERSVYCST